MFVQFCVEVGEIKPYSGYILVNNIENINRAGTQMEGVYINTYSIKVEYMNDKRIHISCIFI